MDNLLEATSNFISMNDILAVVVLYNENLYSSVSFVSLMQAVRSGGANTTAPFGVR